MNYAARFVITFALVLTSAFLGAEAGAQTRKPILNEQAEAAIANRLFDQKQYDRSLLWFKYLVKRYPTRALYWFNLGNLYFLQNDYQNALVAYQRVVDLRGGLTPVAQLYRAKCYRKLGETSLAQQELSNVLRLRLPPNIRAEVDSETALVQAEARQSRAGEFLKEGIAYYQENDYESAVEWFDGSLTVSPNPEAAMMLGLSNLRMGEPYKARDYFSRVLELSPSPQIRLDALFFMQQIREGLWVRKAPYWFYVDSSLGYNSNFYENGYSEDSVASPVFQFLTGFGYHFRSEQALSIRPSYDFSWQEVTNNPNARLFTHQLRVPGIYNKTPWFLAVMPQFQVQFLGPSSFLEKIGLNLRAQRSYGRHDIGAILEYNRNAALDPFYAYLNGDTWWSKLYWAYSGRRYYLSGYYSALIENIGDLNYTNGTLPLNEVSQGLGAAFDYFPDQRWEYLFTFSYMIKGYNHPEAPDFIIRFDRQTNLLGKVYYRVSRDLRVYFSQEAVLNTSTLTASAINDKNFDKFISLGGVVWDALP